MKNSTFIEVKNFTTRETAAALRKTLKVMWPGAKFSVRMDRGSAHGWFRLSYTDGPRWSEVQAVADSFRSERFDGWDDSYHVVEPTVYAREDGSLYEARYSCCGVNVTREYSPNALAWAEKVAVEGTRWWPSDHWQSPASYYAAQALLDGLDLTSGLPANPQDAWKERWQ